MKDTTLCLVNGTGAILQFIYIIIYFQYCESQSLRVSTKYLTSLHLEF